MIRGIISKHIRGTKVSLNIPQREIGNNVISYCPNIIQSYNGWCKLFLTSFNLSLCSLSVITYNLLHHKFVLD